MRHNRRDDGQLSCRKREMKTMNANTALDGHTTVIKMAERGGVPLTVRAIAEVCRSPAKQTKLVETPPSLPLPETNKSSHFSSQTNVYTKHHLKPKVRFFRKPSHSQTNFVRFTRLLQTFQHKQLFLSHLACTPYLAPATASSSTRTSNSLHHMSMI